MGRERKGELTSLQKKEVSGEAGMRGERGREGEAVTSPFDLCTLSIWGRLRCCLSLAIVS